MRFSGRFSLRESIEIKASRLTWAKSPPPLKADRVLRGAGRVTLLCGPEGAWLCRSASLSPAPCQGPSCILAGCRPPCVPPSQALAPIAPTCRLSRSSSWSLACFPPGHFGAGDLTPWQLRWSFSPENRCPQGLLSVESSKPQNEHMFFALPPKVGLPQHDMPGLPFARAGTYSSARPREGSRDARPAGTRATWILLSRE